MEPVQIAWLRKLERDIQEEYEGVHATAPRDPQRAGHEGESAWTRLFEHWLPPAYTLGHRRYIVPEIGGRDQAFETDLVVFRPSYPQALRSRTEVLAGGVAAAFSVKLTLNAAGIEDAVRRAARLRRGLLPRQGSPRQEMEPPFPVGLLAHSHAWKKKGSKPVGNITKALNRWDAKLAEHPREILDMVCVADLNCWMALRQPYISPQGARWLSAPTEEQRQVGYMCTAISTGDSISGSCPVGMFLCSLLSRLAFQDPTLKPFVEALRLTGTLGTGCAVQRYWNLSQVFRPETIAGLADGKFSEAELKVSY